MKKYMLFIVVALIALLLVGFAPLTQERGGILRVAYSFEPDTLNSLTTQNLGDIHQNFNEGLVTITNENKIVAKLAKAVPSLEDGTIIVNDDDTVTMSWELHEGITWHDGTPFTSADVCFTWNFAKDEASMVYNFGDYMNITDCEIIDDTHFILHWNGLHAGWDALLDSMLPVHLFEGKSIEEIVNDEGFNRKPIGTGPFVMAEWKVGEYIKLDRNANYWRGADSPYLDGIVFSFIPDPNTRLNGMKAGEFDYTELDPTQVGEAENISGTKLELTPTSTYFYIGFSTINESGKIFYSDVRVRQAIAYAIDREIIATELLDGAVAAAYSPIVPASEFYSPTLPILDNDPEKAKALLAEAGWTDTNGNGIVDKDGVEFKTSIIVRNVNMRINVVTAVQSMLKAVGIELTLEPMESAALTNRWRVGDWDLNFAGWVPSVDPSQTNFFACGQGNNPGGYCDPEFDTLMLKSDGLVLDPETRKPLMNQIADYMAENVVNLPMYYNVKPTLMNEKLMGVLPGGSNLGNFWNTQDWYLTK